MILGLFVGLPIVALAAAFQVATGGTGAQTFLQGLVYSSGGTSALTATSSGLTVDHLYATSTSATSTLAYGLNLTTGGCFAIKGACLVQGGVGTVTSITTGAGLNGGTITTTGTLSLTSYISTSSLETAGQVAVWGSSSGFPAKLYSVATGTVSGSGPITVTAGQSIIGNGLTIGCSTCSTQTLTFSTPLILNASNVTFSGMTTSTPLTGGQVIYATNANTVTSIATSTPTLSAAFSNTGTTGNFVGGTSGTINNIITRSFTGVPTTTAGTFVGTTTYQLMEGLVAETLTGYRCSTFPAQYLFAALQFGNGSASTSLVYASSTNNFITTNFAIAAGDKFAVSFGTSTAAAFNQVNCSLQFKI